MRGKTNAVVMIGEGGGGSQYDEWFGDGSDGDFVVAAGETVQLSVALDEGQIVKNYKNLTIEEGGVLTAANRCNGMVLLVQGDLTVNGTISMDKKAPLLNTMEDMCAQEMHVAKCALTGGNGGAGGAGTTYNHSSKAYISSSGIGGNGFAFGGGFGGGSGSVGYATTSFITYYNAGSGERAPIGTTIPYPAGKNVSLYGVGGTIASISGNAGVGGAGYGGSGGVMAWSYSSSLSQYSGGSVFNGSAGDAIGGGAIWIFVKGKVIIGGSGVITADGGNGGAGALGTFTASGSYGNNSSMSGGGGAGGGGIIAIVHTGSYNNAGSVAARGGVGGAPAVSSFSASSYSQAGGNGDIGAVLVTTIGDLLSD